MKGCNLSPTKHKIMTGEAHEAWEIAKIKGDLVLAHAVRN